MSSAAPKMIVLKSSDGEFFQVEESIALQCKTIGHMIEDGCADSTIPLPNVSSNILSKVIEYCKRHAQDAASASTSEYGLRPCQIISDEDLKRFDSEFVKVDQSTLFDLILAADYLNVSKLLDLACQTVTDMMKGKTVEEIRKIFNINSDFTPEEEAEIRRGCAWAFE